MSLAYQCRLVGLSSYRRSGLCARADEWRLNLKQGDMHFDQERCESDDVCQVWSATNAGGDVVPVRIECTMGKGFSGIIMIGGVGQICEDGKERAKAALERLGWTAPARKTIISVSPGDAKVDRNHLDLAFCIALSGVMNSGKWQVDPSVWMFAAEVGLNGELRPVAGAVAWASAAMSGAFRGIVVAEGNLRELDCMKQINGGLGRAFDCLGFSSIKDVLHWLESGTYENSSSVIKAEPPGHQEERTLDFDDMHLSEEQRLLACVVTAGCHSLFMRGSPGTGKSMFAKRIPSILPEMPPEQHIKSLKIYSAAHAHVPACIISGRPPFRNPHHYTSLAAIVGTTDHPGELSLASGGVLFLDELPEFRRDVLEGLREPLESGEVAVSRAAGKQTWAADLVLLAAANNCPCGWAGSRRRRCECPPSRLNAYRNRLSGPLQDRIDIHVNMPENSNQVASLLDGPVSRSGQTDSMKDIVRKARDRARVRAKQTGVLLNKDIPPNRIFESLGLPSNKAEMLVTRVVSNNVSTRSLLRCLRVTRTIADIMGRDIVHEDDLQLAWSWQSYPAAKKRGEVIPI